MIVPGTHFLLVVRRVLHVIVVMVLMVEHEPIKRAIRCNHIAFIISLHRINLVQ